MIKQRSFLLGALVSLGLGLSHGALAQTGQPEKETESLKVPEGVGSATILTVHAKIVRVDETGKLVTIEGPNGGEMVVNANNPYNLAAAKVGEPVVVRFYEMATIRKKQPGETFPAKASLSKGLVTAEPGQVPGAAYGEKLTRVVSVVAIDQANGTATVKAPDGTTQTVKARDPNNLKLLKAGDELVVTHAEAEAISLEQSSVPSTSP
jgi:hypothetical protein